jgi:hypothetical protein
MWKRRCDSMFHQWHNYRALVEVTTMFGRGLTPAADAFLERQLRREMEFQNSAAGRMMSREIERLNSPEGQLMQALSRFNDPALELLRWSAQDPRQTVHESRLWYYRKVANLVTFADIRKAVNELLAKLFPKFDPESLARRIRAALLAQDERNGVVKAHSPPVRLIPKTLHPIEAVA